jgi:hypothetical protein
VAYRVPFDYEVTVERREPAEWIVAAPRGGRALHVYRIGACDWLVSEVGRSTEGRETDLKRALAALDSAVWPAGTWDAIARALGEHDGSGLKSRAARKA